MDQRQGYYVGVIFEGRQHSTVFPFSHKIQSLPHLSNLHISSVVHHTENMAGRARELVYIGRGALINHDACARGIIIVRGTNYKYRGTVNYSPHSNLLVRI